MEHLFPVILIVDDEDDILEFMNYNLEKEGYKVYKAKNGAEGIEVALKIIPDIIVLDIKLPDMDGIEVCRTLRGMEVFKKTIIAMLTAHGNDQLQSTAFDLGADDFITKPIRPRLFLCHMNALLRRKKPLNTDKNLLIFKNLIIDCEAYTVTKNNKKANLSKKEIQLLLYLVSKPGKVFNRSEIMMHVWRHEESIGERTIDVHIKKLRDKIGIFHIKTIKGIGYVFVA
jgi:two-component system alkaline phosphatase synthesis response regulator PhoP